MLRELAFAFVMVAVCVVIHTTGLVIFFDWLGKQRAMIEQHSSMLSYALLLILVFGVIIILHLADTSIWAAFYYWRNLSWSSKLRSISRSEATQQSAMETWSFRNLGGYLEA